MTKWAYSKIIEPIRLQSGPAQPARLIFLGASQEEERIHEIDPPERALARLGAEGWELVSHNQPFPMVEGRGVLPTVEVYHLKRPVE